MICFFCVVSVRASEKEKRGKALASMRDGDNVQTGSFIIGLEENEVLDDEDVLVIMATMMFFLLLQSGCCSFNSFGLSHSPNIKEQVKTTS